MNPKYRIRQPRRILESKLLKQITQLDNVEKKSNYGFLSHIYGLIDYDDSNIYVVDN